VNKYRGIFIQCVRGGVEGIGGIGLGRRIYSREHEFIRFQDSQNTRQNFRDVTIHKAGSKPT
jgi:hypothetical protein